MISVFIFKIYQKLRPTCHGDMNLSGFGFHNLSLFLLLHITCFSKLLGFSDTEEVKFSNVHLSCSIWYSYAYISTILILSICIPTDRFSVDPDQTAQKYLSCDMTKPTK